MLTEYGENLYLQCEVYDKYCILRVSPEVGGGGGGGGGRGAPGGIPFITHMSLSMICRKSVDFVIFSQFFAILLKMTLPQADP